MTSGQLMRRRLGSPRAWLVRVPIMALVGILGAQLGRKVEEFHPVVHETRAVLGIDVGPIHGSDMKMRARLTSPVVLEALLHGSQVIPPEEKVLFMSEPYTEVIGVVVSGPTERDRASTMEKLAATLESGLTRLRQVRQRRFLQALERMAIEEAKLGNEEWVAELEIQQRQTALEMLKEQPAVMVLQVTGAWRQPPLAKSSSPSVLFFGLGFLGTAVLLTLFGWPR